MPSYKLAYRIFNFAALLSILLNLVQPAFITYAQPEVTPATSLITPLAPDPLLETVSQPQGPELELPSLEPISSALQQALEDSVKTNRGGSTPTELFSASTSPFAVVANAIAPDPLAHLAPFLPQPERMQPPINIPQSTDLLAKLRPVAPLPGDEQLEIEEIKSQARVELYPGQYGQVINEEVSPLLNKSVPALSSSVLNVNSPQREDFLQTQKIQPLPENKIATTIITDSSSISITTEGFDPKVLTTTLDTTITWLNNTGQTQRLRGGRPVFEFYLPLILKTLEITGSNNGVTASPPGSDPDLFNPEVWSDTILPGQSFGRAFTQVGEYPYYLADSPAITGVIVVQPRPAFSMTITPTVQTITSGQTITYSYVLTGANDFTDSLTLSMKGGPEGASGLFDPNPIIPAASGLLTVTVPSTTPLGSYPLAITANGNQISRTVTVFLNVTVPSTSTPWRLSLTPTTQVISQGQVITYSYAITSANEFTETVALSVSGLPEGSKSTMVPNPVVPDDTGVLTVSTEVTSPVGVYPLTVTAKSGEISQTATVSLTLLATPVDTITVTASAGGVLVSSDGRLRLEIPAGAVTSTTTISYWQLPNRSTFGFQSTNLFFKLAAQDEQGTAVSQFRKNLVFTVNYEEIPGQDEEALKFFYSQEAIYWQPISTTLVNTTTNQIIANLDHFTRFAVGIGDDVPEYVTTAFVAAYNRNHDEGIITTEPTSAVHKWDITDGPWIQDFTNENGGIIYNPATGNAHYIYGDHMDHYLAHNGPYGFLGLPLSDRVDPPADYLLFDKHTHFLNNPIQKFENGFIGYDTEGSNGNGYKAVYYYPVLKSATVKVQLYTVTIPGTPPQVITKTRVTLTAGDVLPNPPKNDEGIAGIWIESDNPDFRDWIPNQGTSPKVWDNLDPTGEFSLRLEAWANTGQAGYLLCDSFKKELAGEEYLYGPILLNQSATYSLAYSCEGFGGGGHFIDITAPVIVHEPEVEDSPVGVWQNGKGWAIIAAEVTDNVGVAWVKVTVNGQEYPMTWLEGDIYVGIIPLKLGRNRYFISASDPSNNLARHPETGEHELWSDMAFSYGYRPWMAYSDDPVNTGIGNFVYHYKDAEIPALGPDIVIERWFNHQSRYNGPLGIGWTFLYDMRLKFVDNLLFSGVQLRYADGRVVNFEGDGNGGFTAPETVQDTLEKVDSEYLLTTKDQTAYLFSEEGRLISISDKDGNTLRLNYSGEELDSIVDASSRTLTLSYANGHITTITIPDYGTLEYEYQADRLVSATDAAGNQVLYTYDEITGCLKSITSPEGKPFLAQQSCDEDRRVTYQLGGTGYVNEFSYDDATKTTTTLDPFGNTAQHVYDDDYRVIENQDALGNSVTYTYNDDYLPLTVTDKNGNTTTYTYDNNGNTLTVTDALGNVTRYTYDANNNMNSRTDALGNTTTYLYDAEDHLIRETDPLGAVTQYAYNSEGLLIRTVDPLGHVTETTYNALGLPETMTDGLGNTTTRVYDAAGRLVSETDPLGYTTTYQYNSLSQVASMTDPEGNVTSYEYDGDQNLVRETNAEGYSRTFTYDDNNRLVAETDWAGNVTTYVYDDLARKIAEIDPLGHQITYGYDAASNLVAQTDKRGATTTYTYDANGNRLTQTDALGHVTRYTYDVLNRQIEVSLPCDCPSRVEHTVYDALGRGIEQINALGNSTRFEYDPLGREVRRIDALGNETIRVYDLAGNLIEEIDALGNSTLYEYDPLNRQVAITNRLGYTTKQEYDAAGRRIAEIDERDHRTERVYDGNDRLLQTIDALGNSTSYTYDGRGNRLTTTDALGRVTELVYDANGNIISLTNPRGYTTHFNYDALNQRTAMTDALGYVTTFTYDEAGAQLTLTDPLGYVQQTTYDILGRTLTEIDRNGNTTTFAYDAAGNLIQVTDALGGITRYTHDANNNRLSETNPLGDSTHYGYDALNRNIELRDALGGITRSLYDALGRLVELVDANGHATQFTYDAEGQLIATTDALGHSSANGYDPAGNLIEETDRNGNTTRHTYDALNREIAVTNGLGDTGNVTYDAVGNVVSRVNFRGYTTRFFYDENNNLIRQIDALDGVTRYDYDALDRKISETDANGHTTTYSYDPVGNLLTVTLPEGQLSSYSYDGEGNRLTTTNALGFSTTYHYDALNRQVTETNPLGYVTTKTYDAIGQITAVVDANGNPTHYTYDALGRLTAVTDALGYTTSYSYDAVGNRLSKTDANGHATIFSYDAVNRLERETNPVGSTWHYVYDPEGNLIEHVDANGQTIRYDFDAVHQLLAIRFADSSHNVTYVYDENGNLIRIVDPLGTTTLVYDELDRELSKTDGYGYITSKEYDVVGNRLALSYPDGNRVSYTYNGNDWLITMSDPRQGQTRYTYQDDGQIKRIDQPNTTWALMVYDDAGRLVRLFNGTEYHDGVVMSYDYTLDKVGNRLQTIEQYTQGQIRTNTKTYSYNARYEIVEAVEAYEGPPAYMVTTRYTYDRAGNRLSMTTNRDLGPGPQPDPQTTLYTYDVANRMLSAGGITFTYDANGNRLTKLTSTVPASQSRLESYEYDEQNRLVLYTRKRAQNGQVEQRVYSLYDGLGRRVNKGTQESSGVIKWTRYALDGLSYDQLAEYPQVGPPRVTELYRGVNNQLISMDEIQGGGSGSQYWFAHDGLESVAATTKQNGQSTHEFFYDPYGQLIDENGHWEDSSSWTDPHNHYLLSGKEWDEESRLYYFGARFYDAQVGVWLTPDPYRGEARVPLTLHPYFSLGHNPPNQADNANDPMSLHRYLYVQNNPLNRIDIDGYSACGPYAKCREDDAIHPLIQLLFGYKGVGLSASWEVSLNVINFLDNTVDLNIPDSKLEDFVEEYVQLDLAIGVLVETKVGVNPLYGTVESCRSVNPYVRGSIGLEAPIPGASYKVPVIGGIGLSVGAGIEGRLQGTVEGCAIGDVNIIGGLDLQRSLIKKTSIVAALELKGYVKGAAKALLVSAAVEAGLRGGIEWPLLECSENSTSSVRGGTDNYGGCERNADMTGYVDTYAAFEGPFNFTGEVSHRVMEGNFKSFLPNFIDLIKMFH